MFRGLCARWASYGMSHRANGHFVISSSIPHSTFNQFKIESNISCQNMPVMGNSSSLVMMKHTYPRSCMVWMVSLSVSFFHARELNSKMMKRMDLASSNSSEERSMNGSIPSMSNLSKNTGISNISPHLPFASANRSVSDTTPIVSTSLESLSVSNMSVA